jgi:hypothetical protein
VKNPLHRRGAEKRRKQKTYEGDAMNYFDLYSSYPDHTITAAWDCQMTEAAQTPWLKELLLRRGSDLFPRFAAYYAELRVLPRSARRALQRQIARSSEPVAIFPEWLQSGGGRELQYKLARSLAGAALLLALGQGLASAATITVTTNNPNIIADGQCSLIEAIVNANSDAATHADCAAGSGADTIVLPTGTHKLTNVNNSTYYYGPTGLPLITSPITIQGNGATIVRRGGAAFRLIAVESSGNLTLQNVNLKGGNSDYYQGGGILNFGTLTIQSSTISGNAASSGGGITNTYYGSLTIENSTISGNTAQYTGGGVANYCCGTLSIENSTISKNSADVWGGGVFSFGPLSIGNSTISGNKAGYGAGVANGGSAAIENSTISKNSANSYGYGGGVFNFSFYGNSNLTITNSTISGNNADRGGGVSNVSFFYENHSSLIIKNSLISGNKASQGAEIDSSSSVSADNFNLFGANGNAGVTGFVPGLTDIVPAKGVKVKNIVAPLKNNGGPTQTHALAPGSPALNVVPFTDPNCTSTDQRGVDRPQGTGCDIGAFEQSGP